MARAANLPARQTLFAKRSPGTMIKLNSGRLGISGWLKWERTAGLNKTENHRLHWIPVTLSSLRPSTTSGSLDLAGASISSPGCRQLCALRNQGNSTQHLSVPIRPKRDCSSRLSDAALAFWSSGERQASAGATSAPYGTSDSLSSSCHTTLQQSRCTVDPHKPEMQRYAAPIHGGLQLAL